MLPVPDDDGWWHGILQVACRNRVPDALSTVNIFPLSIGTHMPEGNAMEPLL